MEPFFSLQTQIRCNSPPSPPKNTQHDPLPHDISLDEPDVCRSRRKRQPSAASERLIRMTNMATNRPSAHLLPSDPSTGVKRQNNLKLSGLPRYHPARFPAAGVSASSSAASSLVTSPASNLNSPPAPLSPRSQHLYHSTHQRQFSDAQRQLYVHQRGLVSLNRFNAAHSPVRSPPPTSAASLRSSKPTSPRLDPLGSPGPVTPLELEEHDGYLFAAGAQSKKLSEAAKDEILESYIRKELADGRAPTGVDGGRQSPRSSRKGDFTKHRSNLSR